MSSEPRDMQPFEKKGNRSKLIAIASAVFTGTVSVLVYIKYPKAPWFYVVMGTLSFLNGLLNLYLVQKEIKVHYRLFRLSIWLMVMIWYAGRYYQEFDLEGMIFHFVFTVFWSVFFFLPREKSTLSTE